MSRGYSAQFSLRWLPGGSQCVQCASLASSGGNQPGERQQRHECRGGGRCGVGVAVAGRGEWVGMRLAVLLVKPKLLRLVMRVTEGDCGEQYAMCFDQAVPWRKCCRPSSVAVAGWCLPRGTQMRRQKSQ